MEEISKEHLSLAGEFAVASELCRREIYAQLTLGLRKRTDLLVDNETGMLRIQVKAKQIDHWTCQGIFGENIVLVFVDYENKAPDQRPDFYVLTPSDWAKTLLKLKLEWLDDYISKGKVKIDEQNCPIWIGREGKPSFKGVWVEPGDISQHKEQWDKIKALLKKRNKSSET